MGIPHSINKSGDIAPKRMKGTTQLPCPLRLLRGRRKKSIVARPLKGQGKGQHRLNIAAGTECCKDNFHVLFGVSVCLS